MREARALEEIVKASSSELRSVPVAALSDVQRNQVAAWVSATKRLPKLREKLFLEGIERADDYWATPEAFRRSLRGLQAIVEEASASRKPTVVTKETSFDPRVAVEITKLGYAMGRGWSFVVHLLALYGLKAVTDGMRREGIVPPRGVASVPSPQTIIEADERRLEKLARYARLDGDPALQAFGFPDDDDYLLDDDVLEEERDESHRKEAADVF